MSLPVPPDAETILQNCIVTLREIVVPDVRDEWARFSAELLIGAIEYAIGRLGEDRAEGHRVELGAAVETLRRAIDESAEEELVLAVQQDSPFEAASRLLVWSQNRPGPLADRIQSTLRPVLLDQMHREMDAAEPIMTVLRKGMRGEL